MRRFGWIALLLAVWFGAVPAAHAERIALVIGNQAYSSAVGRLDNPHNDIAVVGKALAEVEFRVLAPLKDANREDILLGVYALAAEARKAGPGAVTFLYYAGHGVAVAGENMLIPVNARSTTDAEIVVRGVKLGEILDTLKRGAPEAVHFVVIDACRNKLRGARGDRGFIPVNYQQRGMVVAFATAEGETATDEGVRSAPYAAALAEALVKPGYNDQQVFNAVRQRVVAVTQNQTPWTNDGLIGDRIVFKRALSPDATVADPSKGTPGLSEARLAWLYMKDSTDIRDLEAYRKQFGPSNPHYDRQAERRIEELRKTEAARLAAEAAKKKAEDDAHAKAEADRQRIALLQKEEERKSAEADLLRPGRTFRDCEVCPEMVVVPAGSFMMGSPTGEAGREPFLKGAESPQRRVTIARPFAVGRFEVTFAEWDACVAAGACRHRPGDEGWGRGRRPVLNVSWNDITQEYLPWLSRRAGKTYRLLAEAEWEYAARAGTTTRYHFGNDEAGLCTYGNVADQSAKEGHSDWTIVDCRDGYVKTAPVGSFQPNKFGLRDMHGNVWEWVQDCWNPSYSGAPLEGSPWTTGNCRLRVRRGGSWGNHGEALRSAIRNGIPPAVRNLDVGFRVGRTL